MIQSKYWKYLKEVCVECKRPFRMHFTDKKMTNGRGETMYGFEGKYKCRKCVTNSNNGRPPLVLKDLNDIRQHGVSKEQYYKEHGY